MGWKLARQLAIIALLGAVAGGLTGLLGRLAMRLLAVTSPPIAQGRLTDDLARVGEITVAGTAFIVVLCAVVGAFVALGYPLVRLVLPLTLAARIVGFAVLTGLVGGSILVHDDPSFDYTILEPAGLAVTLFICVPAAYGAMAAVLIERYAPAGGALPAHRVLGRSAMLVGVGVYVVLVLWGGYGLVTDIISLAMDTPSNAPGTL